MVALIKQPKPKIAPADKEFSSLCKSISRLMDFVKMGAPACILYDELQILRKRARRLQKVLKSQ